MEEQERGYSSVDDKFVGEDCIYDNELKSYIRTNGGNGVCSYTQKKGIVVPINDLLEEIMQRIRSLYTDASELPWDSEEKCYILGKVVDTYDILMEDFGLGENNELFQDILGALGNQQWTPILDAEVDEYGGFEEDSDYTICTLKVQQSLEDFCGSKVFRAVTEKYTSYGWEIEDFKISNIDSPRSQLYLFDLSFVAKAKSDGNKISGTVRCTYAENSDDINWSNITIDNEFNTPEGNQKVQSSESSITELDVDMKKNFKNEIQGRVDIVNDDSVRKRIPELLESQEFILTIAPIIHTAKDAGWEISIYKILPLEGAYKVDVFGTSVGLLKEKKFHIEAQFDVLSKQWKKILPMLYVGDFPTDKDYTTFNCKEPLPSDELVMQRPEFIDKIGPGGIQTWRVEGRDVLLLKGLYRYTISGENIFDNRKFRFSCKIERYTGKFIEYLESNKDDFSGIGIDAFRENSKLCLNAEKYSDALMDLFVNTKGEFNFALFGEWGRGKTRLMELLAGKLQKQGYEIVNFKAWKYRSIPSLWVFLYETFLKSIKNKGFLTKCPIYYRIALRKSGPLIWIVLKGFILGLFFCSILNMRIFSAVTFILTLLLSWRSLGKLFNVFKEINNNPQRYLEKLGALPSYKEKLGLQETINNNLTKLIEGWIDPKFNKIKYLKPIAGLNFLLCIIPFLVVQIISYFKPGFIDIPWYLKCLIILTMTVIIFIGEYIFLLKKTYLENNNSKNIVFTCFDTFGELLIDFLFIPLAWRLSIIRTYTQDILKKYLDKIIYFNNSSKKILLVVDDLDRCEISEMLCVIESIVLLLDEDNLNERLQVAMLVEERILRLAIERKYKLVISEFSELVTNKANNKCVSIENEAKEKCALKKNEANDECKISQREAEEICVSIENEAKEKCALKKNEANNLSIAKKNLLIDDNIEKLFSCYLRLLPLNKDEQWEVAFNSLKEYNDSLEDYAKSPLSSRNINRGVEKRKDSAISSNSEFSQESSDNSSQKHHYDGQLIASEMLTQDECNLFHEKIFNNVLIANDLTPRSIKNLISKYLLARQVIQHFGKRPDPQLLLTLIAENYLNKDKYFLNPTTKGILDSTGKFYDCVICQIF